MCIYKWKISMSLVKERERETQRQRQRERQIDRQNEGHSLHIENSHPELWGGLNPRQLPVTPYNVNKNCM